MFIASMPMCRHPAAEAVVKLCSAAAGDAAFTEAAVSLKGMLETSDEDIRQQNLAVCLQCNGLHKVLALAMRTDTGAIDALCSLMYICTLMLQSVPVRDSFAKQARVCCPRMASASALSVLAEHPLPL
jgi:hypothetical protein